jgi:hypothetical protein
LENLNLSLNQFPEAVNGICKLFLLIIFLSAQKPPHNKKAALPPLFYYGVPELP